MRARFRLLQRLNRHAEQLEAAFLERGVDARGPLHLAAAAHELNVILGETVHTIAALLLGGLAGAVGRRDDRRHVFVVGRNRHHTDAGAEPKYPLLPIEAKISHRFAQRLGHAHGLIERAAFEQDAEFVAA